MTDQLISQPSGPRFPAAFLVGLLSILCFPLLLVLTLLFSQIVLIERLAGILIFLPLPLGFALGIVAWILASLKLKKIPEAEENVSVRKRLKTGRILGILGTFLFTPVYIIFLSYMSGSHAPPEHYVESDIDDIAFTAYQYRSKPDSTGKIHESYVGYVLPGYLDRRRFAEFRIISATRDSLTVSAVMIEDSLSTLTAVIGPRGDVDRWERTGVFVKEIR